MTNRRWLMTIFLILFTLVVGAICVMIGATPLVINPDFYSTLPDATLRVQDSAFHLRNERCDVLVFGDSTALTGVDPRVIKADTELTACNIAVTRPIVDALGTLPLDDFLAHSPKPKFLVLQFGPETFFRGKPWDNVAGIAPLAMLMRQRPGSSTVWTMIKHPSLTLQFYIGILRYKFFPRQGELAKFKQVYRQPFEEYGTSGGLLTLVDPPQNACLMPALKLYGPLDPGWPKQLRAKYEAMGMQVLIKASPVPDCDPQLQFFREALAPLVDSNVAPLPIHDFIIGDRHMTLEGAQAETHELARRLLDRERTRLPAASQ